jgi:hypothetical protein
MFLRQWKHFVLVVTCHVLKAVKTFCPSSYLHVPNAVKMFCNAGYLSCSKCSENVLQCWLPVMFQRQWKRFAILVTCHVPKAVKTFCNAGYLSCSKGSENVLPYLHFVTGYLSCSKGSENVLPYWLPVVLKAVKPFVLVVTCNVPKAVKTFCPSIYLSCSRGSEKILY